MRAGRGPAPTQIHALLTKINVGPASVPARCAARAMACLKILCGPAGTPGPNTNRKGSQIDVGAGPLAGPTLAQLGWILRPFMPGYFLPIPCASVEIFPFPEALQSEVICTGLWFGASSCQPALGFRYAACPSIRKNPADARTHGRLASLVDNACLLARGQFQALGARLPEISCLNIRTVQGQL